MGLYEFELALGSSGTESFQARAGGSWIPGRRVQGVGVCLGFRDLRFRVPGLLCLGFMGLGLKGLRVPGAP